MLAKFLIWVGVLSYLTAIGVAIWYDTHPVESYYASAEHMEIVGGRMKWVAFPIVMGSISFVCGVLIWLINKVFQGAEAADKYVTDKIKYLQTPEGQKELKKRYRAMRKAEKQSKDPVGIRRD